mmetsp:Transcript_9641/g.14171  ORF Transcript_9641/g.14171 Transcript_9641/m.14171 type:complete len:212 (+) Transcript_9641:1008-1643(+)
MLGVPDMVDETVLVSPVVEYLSSIEPATAIPDARSSFLLLTLESESSGLRLTGELTDDDANDFFDDVVDMSEVSSFTDSEQVVVRGASPASIIGSFFAQRSSLVPVGILGKDITVRSSSTGPRWCTTITRGIGSDNGTASADSVVELLPPISLDLVATIGSSETPSTALQDQEEPQPLLERPPCDSLDVLCSRVSFSSSSAAQRACPAATE